MSSATIVTIKGKSYEFVNKDGKTALYFSARTTPRADKEKAIREVPPYWFITRNTGELLFAIKPKTPSFKILTVEKLYKSYKGQWFEPLAKNYYELIWVHPLSETVGSTQYQAYKHFTWKEVVDYIDNKDITIATDFLDSGTGDWKASKKAGSGYYLCFIEGLPYWTDAVGQIPFSIWDYKAKCKNGVEKNGAIKWVGYEGAIAATGKTKDILTLNIDKSKTYDNFFILRGSIWASNKYSINTFSTGKSYPAVEIKLMENNISPSLLKVPITKNQLDTYGIMTND